MSAALAAAPTFAEDAPTDAQLAERSHAAIANGEHGAAIDALEALADRGRLDPGLSFNRGLAYAMRVGTPAEKPGDLGRAAAAFEETLRLDPGDAEAERLLDAARAEVTRRRARKGHDTVDVRPTLDRIVAGLFSDRTWTIASLVASCLLALGLVLRRFDRPEKTPPPEPRSAEAGAAQSVAGGPAHPVHVAGSVLVVVGVVALAVLVPLAWHARTLRLTTRAGVVVVPEAHLTDESGKAAGGDPVPEAAAVEVREQRGGVVQVRWGAIEGWLPATSVRILP